MGQERAKELIKAEEAWTQADRRPMPPTLIGRVA
jgi:hypothetical protein